MDSIRNMEGTLLLDAGSGGMASQRLIASCFLRHFSNHMLERLDDAARLPGGDGELAMSTDGFTVTPLFFPGGSIGTLAVHGTVNDVAMLGAIPKYLSCAMILEEGLSLETLDRVVADMAAACLEAEVRIVTGDTKVVPRGACDRMFVTTTGIGRIFADPVPSGHNARSGDAVLVSGTMGDHGMTILACREGLSFVSDVKSDTTCLNHMIRDLIQDAGPVHVLRDPTRGGLATTLNEIVGQSGVGIEIEERAVPVRESVANACSLLGLDPMYLANEGKCVCILPENRAQKALDVMRRHGAGADAAVIGRIVQGRPQVSMVTAIGGRRLLGTLEGAMLPRIC
jgi:hydrogenase expression/formation protein HypE